MLKNAGLHNPKPPDINDLMKVILDKIMQICPSDLYQTGFAELSGLLTSEYSEYGFGLSLARKLDNSIIDNISNGPTDSYYDHYHQVNNELNTKVKEIADLFNVNDIKAYPVMATVDDYEIDEKYGATLRYPISHKMIATRAGTGWIGKTDLLITTRFGPRVRLASVLITSCSLGTGTPITESHCGSCNICVQHCPVEAASGESWTIEKDRDKFYDPFKCRNYCKKISAEKIQKQISLCGICMSVCPKGK